MQCGPAFRFPVVVRTARALQPSQSIHGAERIRPRVRDTPLEPADGTGTDTGDHDAPSPRLVEDGWEPPLAPRGEHAPGVSASHIDEILREEDGTEIGRAAEERHVRGFAPMRGERGVEPGDVGISIARRRGQEAYSRVATPGRLQDVGIESAIRLSSGIAASADRDDLRPAHAHAYL